MVTVRGNFFLNILEVAFEVSIDNEWAFHLIFYVDEFECCARFRKCIDCGSEIFAGAVFRMLVEELLRFKVTKTSETEELLMVMIVDVEKETVDVSYPGIMPIPI